MAAPKESCRETPSPLTAAAVQEKEETSPQKKKGMQSCDQPRAFLFHPLMTSSRLLVAVRKRSLTDTNPGGRRRGSSSRDSRAVVEVAFLPRLLCLVSSEPHCSQDSLHVSARYWASRPSGQKQISYSSTKCNQLD